MRAAPLYMDVLTDKGQTWSVQDSSIGPKLQGRRLKLEGGVNGVSTWRRPIKPIECI